MNSNPFSPKWHIKPRVFVTLLILLLVIFSCVFFAFNIFTTEYIRKNVETQLDDLTNNDNFDMSGRPGIPQSEFIPPRDLPEEAQGDMWLPDISRQRPNRIGSRGEVFIVDENYGVMDFYGFVTGKGTDELLQIADELRRHNVQLSGARYVRIGTETGEYYVSANEDSRRPKTYLVFYVDVAGIYNLVNAINAAMALIVAIAMLVCFFIANRIAGSVTRPIKILSKFADDIGRGEFKRNEFGFSDIEFLELGEAMNQSAEKLELYDKDQRTFFQNVSHELRTPLQVIRFNAEGVEQGLMDITKSATTILTETDRLSGLVEDLLYISRVDSLGGHVEKSENDLRDTLSLCAESLKTLADKNKIRFEFMFDNEPVVFSYNEKHMYRAFSNLISNALRYAKSTVTLRCSQISKQHIVVSVLDNGEGISPEELPHIFERFFKGRDGKHGIGLSIVKSVVELHGGKITVGRDENRWTCFTICFSA